MKKVIVFVVAAFMGFSAISWASDELQQNKKFYFYDTKMGNELYLAQIHGTNCDALNGRISITKRVKGLWGIFKTSEDFLTELPEDKIAKGEFLKEKQGDEVFRCLPYVENIERFLKASNSTVWQYGVDLKDGPLIIRVDDVKRTQQRRLLQGDPPQNIKNVPDGVEWILGRYTQIKKISKCTSFKNEFCVEMDFYEVRADVNKSLYLRIKDASDPFSARQYRLLCWECEAITTSPQALQKSILFLEQNVPHLSIVYGVQGGFMAPDNNLEQSPKWKILRNLLIN